jgi:hypothetical protein
MSETFEGLFLFYVFSLWVLSIISLFKRELSDTLIFAVNALILSLAYKYHLMRMFAAGFYAFLIVNVLMRRLFLQYFQRRGE